VYETLTYVNCLVEINRISIVLVVDVSVFLLFSTIGLLINGVYIVSAAAAVCSARDKKVNVRLSHDEAALFTCSDRPVSR